MMRSVATTIAAAGFLFFLSCTAENGNAATAQEQAPQESTAQEPSITDVKAEKFKELAESGNGTILDVRTPEEVAEGVVAGATHINLFDADFEQRITSLDKSKPVYVYCKVGGRSGQAAEKLKAAGYTVFNFDGGMDAWKGSNYPTVALGE